MIHEGRPAPIDTERQTVAPDGRPLAAQPKWRRDFPIDWSLDEHISRRDFAKFMVLTSGALAAGQLWIALKSGVDHGVENSPAVEIASVGELPIGGSKTFFYPVGSTPRLLVRTGARTFVAYDQQCTHLLCPVVAAVEKGRLHCPCHNGWFDLETGRPLAGPPRRALARVELDVRQDAVYAVGVQESET